MAVDPKGQIINNLVDKLPNNVRYVVDALRGQHYNGRAVKPKDRGDQPIGHYLKNPKNADRFNPSNSPVRQKFNGFVNFCFNDHIELGKGFTNNTDFKNRLSSMVKTSTMPSAEFATAVQNQYNRKRITIASVDYKPIQVVIYDTVDSIWVTMLMKMYSHLFTNPTNMYKYNQGLFEKTTIKNDVVPESIKGHTGGSFNRPFDSNDAGLNLQPGDQRNFITSIDIVQYHGQRGIMHTLFNPLITSFEIDGIDYTDSSACTITLDIAYENFTINPEINAFISEEDLERFSDFNKNEWKQLPREPGTTATTPAAGEKSVYPLAMKERTAEFLNGTSRKKQVSFLDAFSDTESKPSPKTGGAGEGSDAGTGTSSGTYSVNGRDVSEAEYNAHKKRQKDAKAKAFPSFGRDG